VKFVQEPMDLAELKSMAQQGFGTMVKAVVDVTTQIMAVDAELHSDEEAFLLQNGSAQRDLWGINLYPEVDGPDWIEFDSMINVRPASGNPSRGVGDLLVQERIRAIVSRLIRR